MIHHAKLWKKCPLLHPFRVRRSPAFADVGAGGVPAAGGRPGNRSAKPQNASMRGLRSGDVPPPSPSPATCPLATLNYGLLGLGLGA